MQRMKHTVLLAVLAAALLAVPAAAEEITVDQSTQFTFSSEDFTNQESDDGIFLTSVPSSNIASLCLGDRVLRAGDALNRDALDQLSLHTDCITRQDTSVSYYTVADGKVTGSREMTLSSLPRKNDPPTAHNTSLETYKNIANSGQLKASDPEGGDLTYALVEQPRRGTVELAADGSFTYTPKHNKVGKDRFTFTVTDNAGNTSEPATVSIQIKKPSDKATYADLTSDPDAFEAMWLKEEGLFSGSIVGGNLCFSPDEAVSRGEFLVMVMKLVEAEANDSEMTSGFADEDLTPQWLQPYLTAALRNGMITGISSDEGVVFHAASDMTKAEAAVMLQNILQLPTGGAQAVFSPEEECTVPAWAAEDAQAMSQANIPLEIASETEPLTRRDAAKVLYHVHQLIEQEAVSAFYWAQ